MIDEKEEIQIYEYSFGCWLNSLWPPVIPASRADFQTQKDIFFRLIEKWLQEGKIKFCAPDADVYVTSTYKPKYTIDDIEAQWHASPKEIVAYLKAGWPNNVTDIEDPELFKYFYDVIRCPAIIWVDQRTGQLVSS